MDFMECIFHIRRTQILFDSGINSIQFMQCQWITNGTFISFMATIIQNQSHFVRLIWILKWISRYIFGDKMHIFNTLLDLIKNTNLWLTNILIKIHFTKLKMDRKVFVFKHLGQHWLHHLNNIHSYLFVHI